MGRGIGKGLVWRGRGFVWRILAVLFILLVPAPILLLLLFRYVPVPGTPFNIPPVGIVPRPNTLLKAMNDSQFTVS